MYLFSLFVKLFDDVHGFEASGFCSHSRGIKINMVNSTFPIWLLVIFLHTIVNYSRRSSYSNLYLLLLFSIVYSGFTRLPIHYLLTIFHSFPLWLDICVMYVWEEVATSHSNP